MSIDYLDPMPSTLIRYRQTMTGCKSIRDLTSFLTTHLAIFQILQGVWELEANEIGEGIAMEISYDQSVNRSPQASDHSDMPCSVWGWCWMTLDARRRVSPPWHHILLWDVCGTSSTSMICIKEGLPCWPPGMINTTTNWTQQDVHFWMLAPVNY